MANVDLDILKDIPGYKAIFKAILKSQIQQLVEQLVRVTEEESVILTASIADGTLSHLGSESGKFFLEDHEDVKSQFLGFCLKRHHKKKQQEKDEEALKNLSTMPSQYMTPDASQTFLGMDHTSQMSPIPISISRATPRNRSMRHDPYRRGRGGGGGVVRGSSINLGANIHSGVPSTAMFSGSVSENSPVKIEGNSDGNGAELEDNSLVGSKTGSGRHESEGGDSEASNFATGELGLNESDNQMPGERELNTGQTGLGSDSQTLGSELDPNIGIKLEAVTDVDELEITGVEPGRPVMAMPSPRDNWGAYDSSLGATGSQADMSPQPDYKNVKIKTEPEVELPQTEVNVKIKTKPEVELPQTEVNIMYRCHICPFSTKVEQSLKTHIQEEHPDMELNKDIKVEKEDSDKKDDKKDGRFCCHKCGKKLTTRFGMALHIRKHEGTSRYSCEICDAKYSTRLQYQSHLITHNQVEYLKFCDQCGKSFASQASVRRHLSSCPKNKNVTITIFNCQHCTKTFQCKSSLLYHEKAVHKGIVLSCKTCGKTYKWRSSLKAHEQNCKSLQVFKDLLG